MRSTTTGPPGSGGAGGRPCFRRSSLLPAVVLASGGRPCFRRSSFLPAVVLASGGRPCFRRSSLLPAVRLLSAIWRRLGGTGLVPARRPRLRPGQGHHDTEE